MEILFLAVISSVVLSYYDKKGVSSGISKLQFIFLKMLALIPFALLLFIIYPFTFEFNYVSVLLIIALLIINATNYLGFIGVVKKTSPYETSVLLSLTIPIIYFIDTIFGVETFSINSLSFLIIVIIGVIVMAFKEIKIGEFKGSLILSIASTIAKGYVLHFLLMYVSIPVYLVLLHALTAIIIWAFFNKKLQIKALQKKDFKWAFTTQFIGIISLVANALLAEISVSLYMLRTPFRLISTVISSYFIKDKEYGEKPSIKKLIGAVITIVGVLLFLLY